MFSLVLFKSMEEVCVQRNKRRKDGNTDSGLNRGVGGLRSSREDGESRKVAGKWGESRKVARKGDLKK